MSDVRTLGDSVLSSARSVYVVATVLMTIVLVVAAAGIAGGVGYALVEHGHDRTVGIIAAASSLLVGLLSALPYLVAQMLARYVEFRVDADG